MIYRLHMVIFRHDQLAEASWNSPKLGDCQLLTMYRPCLCTSDGCIRTCIHYIHCMALQCIALHYIRKYIHTNTHIGIQTYKNIYYRYFMIFCNVARPINEPQISPGNVLGTDHHPRTKRVRFVELLEHLRQRLSEGGGCFDTGTSARRLCMHIKIYIYIYMHTYNMCVHG
jgi:hypothetical protein